MRAVCDNAARTAALSSSSAPSWAASTSSVGTTTASNEGRTVAVDVDLPDQRGARELGFEVGYRDEFALGELDDVIAAVDICQAIGCEFGHDIAGAVIAVRVEHFGSDLRALVVTGHRSSALDEKFPAGMGFVGAEVAQLGDIDQLVVEAKGPHDATVGGYRADLGEPVGIDNVGLQARFQKRTHLCGQRRGADKTAENPSAEQCFADLGLGRPLGGVAVEAISR